MDLHFDRLVLSTITMTVGIIKRTKAEIIAPKAVAICVIANASVAPSTVRFAG